MIKQGKLVTLAALWLAGEQGVPLDLYPVRILRLRGLALAPKSRNYRSRSAKPKAVTMFIHKNQWLTWLMMPTLYNRAYIQYYTKLYTVCMYSELPKSLWKPHICSTFRKQMHTGKMSSKPPWMQPLLALTCSDHTRPINVQNVLRIIIVKHAGNVMMAVREISLSSTWTVQVLPCWIAALCSVFFQAMFSLKFFQSSRAEVLFLAGTLTNSESYTHTQTHIYSLYTVHQLDQAREKK